MHQYICVLCLQDLIQLDGAHFHDYAGKFEKIPSTRLITIKPIAVFRLYVQEE